MLISRQKSEIFKVDYYNKRIENEFKKDQNHH